MSEKSVPKLMRMRLCSASPRPPYFKYSTGSVTRPCKRMNSAAGLRVTRRGATNATVLRYMLLHSTCPEQSAQ